MALLHTQGCVATTMDARLRMFAVTSGGRDGLTMVVVHMCARRAAGSGRAMELPG